MSGRAGGIDRDIPQKDRKRTTEKPKNLREPYVKPLTGWDDDALDGLLDDMASWDIGNLASWDDAGLDALLGDLAKCDPLPTWNDTELNALLDEMASWGADALDGLAEWDPGILQQILCK